MSGKYMKLKRIIIPTITMAIIASQLFGCAATSQSELLQMINRGDQIEIEVSVPLNKEQGTEQAILWEQLASLTTNETLRSAWDDALLITKTDTGKNGMLYVNASGENDNNNTLRVALHNRAFLRYLENEDNIETLADAALSQYVDIEPEETIQAVYMGINGYFNLLPDADVNYSNPESTLSRAEFMAMVMRAETPVSEITADSDFAVAVGDNELNIYAQEIADDNYLDLESKSLNNLTFNGTITRAEAIYLLMNHYFKDELANVDISDTYLSDAKDGGDIATAQKFIENGTAKDYWRSYELTYAISNPDDGVPTDLYKALVLAEQKGIISSDTRWDDGVTKAEAIELLVSAIEADTSIEKFNYDRGAVDTGYEYAVPEEVTEKAGLNGNGTGDIYVPDEEDLAIEDEATLAQQEAQEADEQIQSEPVADYTVESMDAQTMYAQQSVNLRQGPSTEYDKVGSLSTNQQVTVTGKVTMDNSIWYQLSTGEFVASKYLGTDKVAVTQKPSNPQSTNSNTSNNNNSSPSTSSSSTNDTPQPAANEEEIATSSGSGTGDGSSRANRSGAPEAGSGIGGGNLQ